MTHARTQIRTAVKALLQNLPTTADRVFVGRTRALEEAHEPTLLIYTPRETSARDAMGRPPILARPVALFIEGRVLAAEPPDDLLDQIALEVETAIAADLTLFGLARNLQMVGTETDIQAPGKNHLGAIRIEYRITYRTAEGAPGTVVP